MIQLGRSAYAPARMKIVDDVINMSRMRGRADSTQLAPIQILSLRDPNPDGSGTPITAWAGRGTSSGSMGDNMDTSDAGGDRYSTPNNSFTTSSYASQYPTCGGLGTSATVQSTPTARGGGRGSVQRTVYTPPPPPPPPPPTAVPDLGALSAQLAQALAAIQQLTQENQALGQQNHDMGLQLRDMQSQMQRQQEMQEQEAGVRMESSPPKRQREQEPTEPRSLNTAQPGNQGVGMELNQEANVQGEVGYETVTFDNNTSTRYSDWLHCANATAQRLSASVWEPSLSYTPLASEDGMQEWVDTKSDVNSLSRSYVKQRASNGWDPGPPPHRGN